MPTYRGNRGNLLQHWVLVELLGCIREGGIGKLCFVDAYSMSQTPTRSERAATDQTAQEFDHVRSRLDPSSSVFEQAWLTLISHPSTRHQRPSCAVAGRSVCTSCCARPIDRQPMMLA